MSSEPWRMHRCSISRRPWYLIAGMGARDRLRAPSGASKRGQLGRGPGRHCRGLDRSRQASERLARPAVSTTCAGIDCYITASLILGQPHDVRTQAQNGQGSSRRVQGRRTC